MGRVVGRNNTSLRTRLIEAFFITSIVPMILMNLFSYYNTSNIVRDSVNEQAHLNLEQTKSTLDIWVDSYEDILYQIYMNDDIVKLVRKLNEGDEVNVTAWQLRRALRGMFYTKEYIKSITVITDNGTVVFYDLLTGSLTKTSWMDSFPLTKEEIYKTLSADNDTHVFSTRRAGVFAADTYYLFHIGHRIIDYKNVNEGLGAVVVSIDEEMLQEICSNAQESDSFSFIADRGGRLVSYFDKSLLGSRIIDWSGDVEERKEGYRRFILGQDALKGRYSFVDLVYDEEFGCDIVRVSNHNRVLQGLKGQQRLTMLVLTLSLAALVLIILLLSGRLTGSLQQMAGIMKRAGKGELSARVRVDGKMPGEVQVIADQFNHMLGKLEEAMTKEREAVRKQKNAEIAALEAQINPHFLYNTLDTINWMAIDKDEYEISSSINALAAILRYGIDKSNEAVSVREECDWLKQYLFLQQTRLKNTFECSVHVEPETLECRIHKLLLQPFVENAILHGFEGQKRTRHPQTHRLEVSIYGEKDRLLIKIWDNGRGMPQELVEQMNRGIFPAKEQKNHIGMENAITRIRMYYGEEASVKIESEEGGYTGIYICIPKEEALKE